MYINCCIACYKQCYNHTEDEQAAATAGINFISADIWRDRFKPGIAINPATPQQIEFLEGINLN